MKTKYTRCFEKDGGYWIAYVKELPGANSQGRTKKEAQKNLREAIQLVLEANRDLAKRKIKDGRPIICKQLVAPA
jgi:predicted RNase H-like HicB family nuclease